MRWSNQEEPQGPSPSLDTVDAYVRASLEASRARRRAPRPSRLEVLAAAAPALIIVLGMIGLYVLAGVLTGGPR